MTRLMGTGPISVERSAKEASVALCLKAGYSTKILPKYWGGRYNRLSRMNGEALSLISPLAPSNSETTNILWASGY